MAAQPARALTAAHLREPGDDPGVASGENCPTHAGLETIALIGPLMVGIEPVVAIADGGRDYLERHAAAQAEYARLHQEAESLRGELAKAQAEVARLRRSAEKLPALRAECDRLIAERALMLRDATQHQARLVENQLTLVEVEAELEECRERTLAGRREWEQQRQQLIAEHERARSEHERQFDAERRARLAEQEVHRRVAHEAETLHRKVNKLRRQNQVTCVQRDEALDQAVILGEKVQTLEDRCVRLSTYLDEAQVELRLANETHQAKIQRLDEALSEALEEAEAALERESAHLAQFCALQHELESLRHAAVPSCPSQRSPGFALSPSHGETMEA
jgi:chromosome segregation ATPase